MEPCDPLTCPIGQRLEEHIQSTKKQCDNVDIKNNRLEEKIDAYYKLLLKHTDEEMDKFHKIEGKFETIEKHMSNSVLNDKLFEQKFTFWSKVALWVTMIALTLMGSTLVILARLAFPE